MLSQFSGRGARKVKDGYLFSKSVKGLTAAERAWALSDEGWADVGDGHGGILYRIKEATGGFGYRVTGADGRKRAVPLPEKRVVAYSPSLAVSYTHLTLPTKLEV